MPKSLQTREWEYERFKSFSAEARYFWRIFYYSTILIEKNGKTSRIPIYVICR